MGKNKWAKIKVAALTGRFALSFCYSPAHCLALNIFFLLLLPLAKINAPALYWKRKETVDGNENNKTMGGGITKTKSEATCERSDPRFIFGRRRRLFVFLFPLHFYFSNNFWRWQKY